MKSRTWMLESTFSLLAVLLVATTSTVYAAPIRVDCGKGGSITATLASLASAGNTRGVTTLPVVQIYRSYDVTLQGFTIAGGNIGVVCAENSVCNLTLNTVQNSNTGISVVRADANLDTNQIQPTNTGLDLRAGARVLMVGGTIQGSGRYGVLVGYGSNLTIFSSSILSSGREGILATSTSTMRLFDATISFNGGNGVTLEQASSANFQQDVTGNIITHNGGNGVSVNDLSFAAFEFTNDVSGNLTQPDVACNPQYSATRGASTVGGTTNCVEPQHKK